MTTMEYQYSKGMLRRIAEVYPDIYDGIPELDTHKIINLVWFAVYLLLKVIEGEEPSYKECLEIFQWGNDITDPFLIVEYKADFDRALSELGRDNWDGKCPTNFNHYKHFGRLQRVIIAQMLGLTDSYLEGQGFDNIPKLLGLAYFRMLENLNERETAQS